MHLTLNRPGFSEFGRGEGVDSTPCVTFFSKANDHEIWSCHTMSIVLPGNNKIFDDVITIMFL